MVIQLILGMGKNTFQLLIVVLPFVYCMWAGMAAPQNQYIGWRNGRRAVWWERRRSLHLRVSDRLAGGQISTSEKCSTNTSGCDCGLLDSPRPDVCTEFPRQNARIRPRSVLFKKHRVWNHVLHGYVRENCRFVIGLLDYFLNRRFENRILP